MVELLLSIYNNRTKSPELATLTDKALKINTFVTGNGYNDILAELFPHEAKRKFNPKDDNSETILKWRQSVSKPATKILLSTLNNHFARVVQDINPVLSEVTNDKKNNLGLIFEEFYNGKDVHEYVNDIVNRTALARPFDWLLLDLEGSNTINELPKIKPILIKFEWITNIEFECGKPISLQYCFTNKDDENKIIYVSKNEYIELTKVKDYKDALTLERFVAEYSNKEQLLNEDNVIISLAKDYYKISFFKRNLNNLPAMQIGYEKIDSQDLILGNEFVYLIDDLLKYTRIDSNLSCIVELFIRYKRYEVEFKKERSTAALDSNKPEEKTSNLETTKLEVPEDQMAEFIAQNFNMSNLVYDHIPDKTVYETLKDYLETQKKELQRAITGVELFDKQQINITATEKILEQQAQKQNASKRLAKQKRLIEFIFNTHKSFYLNAGVLGVTEDTILQFAYPTEITVESTSDIIERLKNAKGCVGFNELAGIMKSYYLSESGGDLDITNKKMFWVYVDPLTFETENSTVLMQDSLNVEQPLFSQAMKILHIHKQTIQMIIELKYPNFYDLDFKKKREIVLREAISFDI